MQKTRIGIITYHRFINYGGLLQAYALCTKLNALGADAKVIDYRCMTLENVGNSDLFAKGISIKRRIWKLMSFFQLKEREKLFGRFIEEHLPVTRACYSEADLCALEADFDYIITGSDQVWHSRWPHDPMYFLNFVNDSQKKASYAASLGDLGIPEEKADFYKKALKEYHLLSVREESDREVLSALLDRNDIVTSVDPVLLLEKEDYTSLIENASEKIKAIAQKGDYVLIYTVNEPEKLVAQAKAYAKAHGLSVIYLNPSFVQNIKVHGVKKIKKAGIEDFLALFTGAKMVYTNSFHGTAFSVLFGKPHQVEVSSNGHINKRAKNLLAVEDELATYREASIRYLKQMMSEE